MTEEWVLYAGIAVWIGIGGYVAFLSSIQNKISHKLSQLEILDDKKS